MDPRFNGSGLDVGHKRGKKGFNYLTKAGWLTPGGEDFLWGPFPLSGALGPWVAPRVWANGGKKTPRNLKRGLFTPLGGSQSLGPPFLTPERGVNPGEPFGEIPTHTRGGPRVWAPGSKAATREGELQGSQLGFPTLPKAWGAWVQTRDLGIPRTGRAGPPEPRPLGGIKGWGPGALGGGPPRAIPGKKDPRGWALPLGTRGAQISPGGLSKPPEEGPVWKSSLLQRPKKFPLGGCGG